MSFKNFLEKQEKIYNKFRDTSTVEKEGLTPIIRNQRGGYLIAFRHPNTITDQLEDFSNSVSKIVPTIIYDEKNAHTTISVYQVQDSFSPDIKTLSQLTDFIHANKLLSNKVTINYHAWLLNPDSGIAAGTPNLPFYNLAEKINTHASQKNIQLRFPWGAHITVNRFLENTTPKKIQELLHFYKTKKPLGKSTPEFIDVGYFIFTPDSFNYIVHERFEL